LRSAGIADRDIRTSSISLRSQYSGSEDGPQVSSGYSAGNNLSIRFRDIARAGRVIDALVGAGANQIDGPNLGIDRPDTALDEARALAVTNARARAELYARALGMRIRRVVSVNESSTQDQANFLTTPFRAFAADSTIEPGVQALSVWVTMVFELE
jgi:uncharacterized protein YggE